MGNNIRINISHNSSFKPLKFHNHFHNLDSSPGNGFFSVFSVMASICCLIFELKYKLYVIYKLHVYL